MSTCTCSKCGSEVFVTQESVFPGGIRAAAGKVEQMVNVTCANCRSVTEMPAGQLNFAPPHLLYG